MLIAVQYHIKLYRTVDRTSLDADRSTVSHKMVQNCGQDVP